MAVRTVTAFTTRHAICYKFSVRRGVPAPWDAPFGSITERWETIANEYRINERIRVPEVRLIDDQGTQLGVMPTRQALALATDRGLDLVEVAPNSVPPVCRILDYGKFKYIQSTKEKEVRRTHKPSAVREVRFRPRIGQHDFDAKERLARKLLGEGAKVKVSVMFRGREMDHPELAVALLKRVAEGLKEDAKLEQAPNLEGRMMSILLAPAKVAAKPQYTSSDVPDIEKVS